MYFTLSCIAGILIFSSCVLGQCLSTSLSKSPRNRYLGTPGLSEKYHGCVRSQSIRSRRSLCNGETTMLKYPGYPHQLGSWTDRPRPSSLSLEQMSGTLPSPWTVTNGMKLPASHLRSLPCPHIPSHPPLHLRASARRACGAAHRPTVGALPMWVCTAAGLGLTAVL